MATLNRDRCEGLESKHMPQGLCHMKAGLSHRKPRAVAQEAAWRWHIKPRGKSTRGIFAAVKKKGSRT
jgi:hypothetical protein